MDSCWLADSNVQLKSPFARQEQSKFIAEEDKNTNQNKVDEKIELEGHSDPSGIHYDHCADD